MMLDGWIVRFVEIGHNRGGLGGDCAVQALIELLAGLIALLAAAALGQFGVDLNKAPHPEREVHRVSDCPDAPSRSLIATRRSDDC